ncbi:fructose-1,6-bisphosphatase [Salinarchaeum sp. IM2453]|uniref:class 1 fructose-bisphosphatase n=1 Tax=Salinarchaeum sp. IM2453 TaxID=2862870 RepID=UPI001C82C586|nr:class 1 fructose-bisphosphatase [Salinarchaeum sp. IM2453]QZA87956.1 fructose-1,6-bisphosphatase [Salinarchaeum sp. IM2453]
MSDTVVDAIIDEIAAATPEIREILSGRRGKTAKTNPSGETQIAADVKADELLVDRLSDIDGVGEIATEEREEKITCGNGYAVTLDPLDGSSNLKSNNPMGTIIGIYDAELPAAGTELVAAGSVVYGPITTFTVARDGTVTEYEVINGTKTTANADMMLPDDPTVYGFGGGDAAWTDEFSEFANEIRHELKLRYGGAFVADISQVLTYGGIFAYPSLEGYPDGKLRLQFEGNPVAYITKHAGGASSDGSQSILERSPEGLHDRVPVHVGNTSLIEKLERALQG